MAERKRIGDLLVDAGMITADSCRIHYQIRRLDRSLVMR